ncbi:MAG: PfkB family carbohydrate kinase, partial [Candidatus Aminicenantales bacterium]
EIVYDDGRSFRGLGGVLYQAAALCGFGHSVRLAAQCGENMRGAVEDLVSGWPALDREGLRFVPGPGNRVELRYSERLKERQEILRSVVPPLDPSFLLGRMGDLKLLLMVFNSGFDIELPDWRRVARSARCPIWMDIHSLSLAKLVGSHRDYVALPEWKDWVEGVTYLQANRQEVACMLGRPERWPERGEIEAFAGEAFDRSVRAVFVTMGKDGVLLLTPDETRMIRAPRADRVVDSTGCGDIFCAGTLHRLAAGAELFEAAAFGAAVATRAVGLAGLSETFNLARNAGREIPSV